MKKIGLLSDTHSFLDKTILGHFQQCDEIWHAGDIGDPAVADQLAAFKPFKAVYGNIDGKPIRLRFPENLRFDCEGMDVWITHIGGYPGRYNQRVREEIKAKPPGLFICGHSHILKAMPDKKLNLIHLNPGACGNVGFHKIRTVMRFEISEGKIGKLEVIELGSRG
ncbi:MAG TPA: metallophosphoesterase [Bacteroidetes bacterium]|nr:metallophosphoesterase [Bacteroidota bacterium]